MSEYLLRYDTIQYDTLICNSAWLLYCRRVWCHSMILTVTAHSRPCLGLHWRTSVAMLRLPVS